MVSTATSEGGPLETEAMLVSGRGGGGGGGGQIIIFVLAGIFFLPFDDGVTIKSCSSSSLVLDSGSGTFRLRNRSTSSSAEDKSDASSRLEG